jgi:Fe-Mn family superoxide dismutase
MFALPVLPYSLSALEPYIGYRSLDLHYNVLHRKYVDTVNALTPEEWQANDLLEVIEFADEEGMVRLRDQALQAWNHEFFWQSMRSNDGVVGTASGPLGVLIKRDFGSMGALREAFVEAGVAQFGSGWVWLCLCSEQQLVIKVTANADNPLLWDDRKYPILVCDLWEHSYYPDYGPDRTHYLATWFDMIANFDFAAQNARRVLRLMSESRT